MEILIKRESEPVRIKRVGPQAGGQERFLSATEYEVLFGGVAGPGKTWALVYDSAGFQFAAKLGKPAICFGDYRAVIFRRKTTELVKIIDEGRKLFCRAPLDAEYTQQRRGEPGPSFTFPAGAQIFCCHLQHEEDKFNHHGHEYQYIGFDELPTFTLTQYLYMFHRCRSTIVGLWPRIRATANPVGPGLMWVKKRFIRNGDFRMVPERPYWFVPDMSISDPMQNPMGIEAGPWVKEAKSRIYIPGKLEENQYIQDQDGYKASILQMGRKYAAALLYSDWEAFSGDFFEDFTDDLRVRPFEIPVGWPLFGSLDPGFTSPCSFGLQTVDPNGGIWRLMTYYLSGQSISEHVRNIWDRCRGFMFTAGRMPEYVVCGQDAFPPEGKKGTGDRVYFADVMRDQGLFCKRAVTARVQGWWAWKDAMRRKKWHYFDGYNQAMVEEMVSAQHDEEDPEDIIGHGNDQSVPDHCLDEARYAILATYRPQKPQAVDPFAGRPQWGFERYSSYRNGDPRIIWGPNE